MSELLGFYLAHYDAVFLGMGRRGLANGMHATMGQMFPRAGGGANLYRGIGSAEEIDWTDPVGVVGKEVTAIRNFADRGHDSAQDYCYAVRAISAGGVEQGETPSGVRVSFDGSGSAIIPSVDLPGELVCGPIANGKFGLSWYYRASERSDGPKEFRIYGNGGTGGVDYGTVLGVVEFRFWQRHYAYESAAFATGTTVVWSVRTVNSAGQEERNTVTVSAVADADAPPANDGVLLG